MQRRDPPCSPRPDDLLQPPSLAMDDNLYDEFGNYIGPDLDDDEDQGVDGEFDVKQRQNDGWLPGRSPCARVLVLKTSLVSTDNTLLILI